MMNELRGHGTVAENMKMEYPVFSILVVVMLLYLAPFITSWLAAAAFMISVYRVVRYDARVFAVDYCMMMPLSGLTKIEGGVSLLIYLCLLAGIWYLIRGEIRANASYVLIILLLNYLLARMQLNINDFVLCFGQVFVLYVLLPKQDADSAEQAAKVFCVSLVVSSVYAFALRNTYPLRGLTGSASAPILGTNITRFCGLYADPNYYMTFLAVALALLLKLKDCGRIRNLHFWLQAGFLTFFGIMTYSKTFFLVFVMLVGIFVIWQYWNKKVFRGVFFTAAAMAAMILVLTMENSPVATLLDRFTSAKNLSELTTSRSDVYLLYLEEITADIRTFFFGKGLAAEGLYRAPHNLFLEIAYYTGIIGLTLLCGFYIAMVRIMVKGTADGPRQNLIAKYEVLAVVLVLFFTLHGMLSLVLYAQLFLACISILLTKKEEKV